MRKLNKKIVLFTIVTYYNWCENVICCFVLHTDRPKNFTLDLCCKALHRVHRPNNSSRAVFQRIPQSLISFISFLYLLFFIVKQLDQGNRFTNWIRSLVEITRYSHTHTHKFTLLSSSRVSIEIFRQIRFSSSSYQFTHSRRKAKRPSHFSRFEIVFSASLFKTVTRNFDRGREFVSNADRLRGSCGTRICIMQMQMPVPSKWNSAHTERESQPSVVRTSFRAIGLRFVIIDVRSITSSRRVAELSGKISNRANRRVWKNEGTYFKILKSISLLCFFLFCNNITITF